MKINRYLTFVMAAIFFGGFVVACGHPTDPMAAAEKMFVKKIDKTAGKLDLNESQKLQLEQLKIEIRKNFLEGQKEKEETAAKIKDEGTRENPDSQKMSSLLQGLLRDEMGRINRAFDLTLKYQNHLNDDQKKKFTQIISK